VKLQLSVMSGVDDGMKLLLNDEKSEGQWSSDQSIWRISIGRREENDICLRNDTFVSRLHAYLYWEDGAWWLHDQSSTNGTFIEGIDSDIEARERLCLRPNQLFRIGHTWLRLESE
jgi:predicted component of type VI protein secretion system